ESKHLLVYLKDIQFDSRGNPIVVYVESFSAEAAGEHATRTWLLARFTQDGWRTSKITTSDHNYDFGQLYIDSDKVFRLLAPTDPGPQPHMTGGEIVAWLSEDAG